MVIKILPEHEVTRDAHEKVTALRNASFPDGALPRSYFKQLPHLRALAYDGEDLVGYSGIDHRVMRFGSTPVRIFGLIDLCVDEKVRGQGVGTSLLEAIENLARASNIEALVLIADAHHFYERVGYRLLRTECTWLRIHEHENYGVTTEDLSGELMVKSLVPGLNLKGPVDFLGYLF